MKLARMHFHSKGESFIYIRPENIARDLYLIWFRGYKRGSILFGTREVLYKQFKGVRCGQGN